MNGWYTSSEGEGNSFRDLGNADRDAGQQFSSQNAQSFAARPPACQESCFSVSFIKIGLFVVLIASWSEHAETQQLGALAFGGCPVSQYVYPQYARKLTTAPVIKPQRNLQSRGSDVFIDCSKTDEDETSNRDADGVKNLKEQE